MTATVALERTEHQLLIGGAWRPAADGATYTPTSPATGEPYAELASAGVADVDAAVAAAKAAFARCRDERPFERADRCYAVAAVLERRADELAAELCVEHGKPIEEALGEIHSAVAGLRLAAEEGRRLGGETIPVRDPFKRVHTIRVPRGVYAVITPFNYPANIPIEYIGPALATGNAVVWKPAPSTARIAARMAECMVEAGVPDGLVNLLTGPSLEMSERLVSHPDVVGVGFTGSSAAGAAIARAAAGKHLLMELGGNGPVIVLDDADLERTGPAVAAAAFANAGQSCAAAGRILAATAIAEELAHKVGAEAPAWAPALPWSGGARMGPVHTKAVAATTLRHAEDAVDRGARLLHGGGASAGLPTDLYLEPIVLAGVPAESEVQREETFGPIAAVTPASGDDELLALADASPLGLSAAIFTRDVERALRLAERLSVGQVVINDTSNYWELHMPFGGGPGKQSGIGRVGGRYALEAMTDIRSIAIDVSGGAR